MKFLIAGVTLWAGLLCAQTAINGGRTVKGVWDASGAAATMPVQTGAALPAHCAAGQVFLKTGGDPSRMLYACPATDTWTQTAYAQGTTAQMPAACAMGQMYFATDATAGQNLNLCTAANTWTHMSGGGGGGGGLAGSGAADQVAFFSDSGTVASDSKIIRDSSGNLSAVGMYANSLNAAYSTSAGWRIYFSVDYATCASGAVTLSTAFSVHKVNLNDQAACAVTMSGGNGGELGIVQLCQGSTTPTATLTWNGARGGMAAAGGAGTCMGQTFLYDSSSSNWYATGPGVSNM